MTTDLADINVFFLSRGVISFALPYDICIIYSTVVGLMPVL